MRRIIGIAAALIVLCALALAGCGAGGKWSAGPAAEPKTPQEMYEQILKEAELFRALRMTNDAYISRLDEELSEAEEYLEKPADKDLADAYTGYDIMQKRAQELKLTRSVALSFSKQISLSADNLTSLSDRVWNVQMNLIPLLRGMISAETLKIMRDELNMLFKEPSENREDGLPVYV